MKKIRCARLRLANGGTLRVGDREFTEDQARYFMRQTRQRRRDWSDSLNRLTMELLPKRRRYVAVTPDQYERFLLAQQYAKVRAEIARLERLADGYDLQAQSARKTAERLRAEAASMRAAVA